MGKTVSPATYIYTCDRCGAVKESGANVTRPQKWSKLTLEKGAIDYQGSEVADDSIYRLLCPICTLYFVETLKKFENVD